ncbi:MAG: MarR family transcriptional regulator [Candidatus Thermoplasmatota archaeon]|jgi:predicted transcriptional regulator|nr:MarR family transcriptional regulator [Candidatus Thermoplasmatota archaeon]
MGQAEVIEFFQNHANQWFTTKEISSNINISKGAVSGSLKRLIHQGVVEKRRNSEKRHGFKYRFKH